MDSEKKKTKKSLTKTCKPMSNTKHTPIAKYSLTRLSEEDIMFLKKYATIVNVNDQTWYNLPFWYRKDEGCYFEILPPDKAPKEVKSLQPSENQSLLEALKSMVDFPQEDLEAWAAGNRPIPITYTPQQLSNVLNIIKQAEQ